MQATPVQMHGLVCMPRPAQAELTGSDRPLWVDVQLGSPSHALPLERRLTN
jgi:hypothetical protein